MNLIKDSFCINLEEYIFFNLINYIEEFLNVKHSLYSWNKLDCILTYYVFSLFLYPNIILQVCFKDCGICVLIRLAFVFLLISFLSDFDIRIRVFLYKKQRRLSSLSRPEKSLNSIRQDWRVAGKSFFAPDSPYTLQKPLLSS